MDASTSGGRKRRSVRVGREVEQQRPTIPSILKRDTPTESNIDADFEAYWEGESKNKNRNRIRVGRQYQATVPPLLKPGETDGRKCEDLETLRWKPDNNLSEQQLDQYLSFAKAVSLFAQAIDTYQCSEKPTDKCLQTALRGLSEFVTSHHPCHHDAGCQVPSPATHPSSSNSKCTSGGGGGEWTPAETQLFAKALEACGKNFGAIKKDYLPWKPVKSIIEYYYQGKEEKTESSSPVAAEKQEPPERAMSPTDKKNETVDAKVEVVEDAAATKCEENALQLDEVDSKEDAEAVEVKPVNNKLVQLLSEPSSSNSVSTLGSLQFYLGGRLVLKLNAQQEADSIGDKCHWVQSKDTPKIPPPSRKVKKYKKKAPCDGDDDRTKNSKLWDGSYDSSSDEAEETTPKKPKLWGDSADTVQKTEDQTVVDGSEGFVQSSSSSSSTTSSSGGSAGVKLEPPVHIKSEPLSSPPGHECGGDAHHDASLHHFGKGRKPNTWTPCWPGASANRPRTGTTSLPSTSVAHQEDTKDIPLDLTAKPTVGSSRVKVSSSPHLLPKEGNTTPTNSTSNEVLLKNSAAAALNCNAAFSPFPVPGGFLCASVPLPAKPEGGNAGGKGDEKNCGAAAYGLGDYGMNYPLITTYLHSSSSSKKELDKPVNLCTGEEAPTKSNTPVGKDSSKEAVANYVAQSGDAANPAGFPASWLDGSLASYLSVYPHYYQYYSYAAYGIAPPFPPGATASSTDAPLDLSEKPTVLGNKKAATSDAGGGDKGSKKSSKPNGKATPESSKEKTGPHS